MLVCTWYTAYNKATVIAISESSSGLNRAGSLPVAININNPLSQKGIAPASCTVVLGVQIVMHALVSWLPMARISALLKC